MTDICTDCFNRTCICSEMLDLVIGGVSIRIKGRQVGQYYQAIDKLIDQEYDPAYLRSMRKKRIHDDVNRRTP